MAEVSVIAAWQSPSATFWLVGLRFYLYMEGRFSRIAPDASRESRLASIGRVDLGGRPSRPLTDPDVPIEEASGSSDCGIAVPHTTGSLRRHSLVSLGPPLITEHHSVSGLNDLAREASLSSRYAYEDSAVIRSANSLFIKRMLVYL